MSFRAKESKGKETDKKHKGLKTEHPVSRHWHIGAATWKTLPGKKLKSVASMPRQGVLGVAAPGRQITISLTSLVSVPRNWGLGAAIFEAYV